jgi:class 3 adenylate cyclase/tetratricopeptide (TPR) repeat protein
VLFADLAGFTSLAEGRDPETVKELLDNCFGTLVPVVEAHGGHVDKIIGDEIMALFGAPVAHEDDPERAVRAALGLSGALGDLGADLTLRIAVNTGEVLAGPVGPGQAYTVTGDTVNTAHRLAAAAAPGEVLVGERTWLATRHAIHYEERPPFLLRGKETPVPAWAAVEVRKKRAVDSTTGDMDLVGRGRELSQLTEHARRCLVQAETAVLAVVGEAGVGKTRLAAALIAELEALEPRILRVTCPPYGAASVLTPVTALAAALLGIDTAWPLERQQRRVGEALAELFGEGATPDPMVERRVNRLLGLNVLPEHHLEPDAGPARARVLDDLLAGARSLLEAQARRRPTCILIEDAHWADDLVLDFLGRLPARLPGLPLLVVVLAREDLLERGSALLRGGEGVTPLPLGPLPAEAAGELVRALFERRSAPYSREQVLRFGPEAEGRVVEAAGGNPLLLDELVRHLLEVAAGREAPILALSPEEAGLPDTVRSLLGARLDALAPEERRMLHDAAIVGSRFWLDAVAALDDHPSLESAAEHLLERGLLEEVDHDTRTLAFRHTLTREVAYAAVPLAERATKHARAAMWLREHGEALLGPDPVVALLAHHYERAVMLNRELEHTDPGLAGAAFATLVLAGRNAARQQALREADHWYSRALELGSLNRSATLDAQLAHGAVLTALRHLDQARAAFEAVCREAGSEHPDVLASANAQLGVVARLQGDSDTTRACFAQAQRHWIDIGDARGEAEVLRLQGWSDLEVGRPRSALNRLRRAATLEASLPEGRVRADTLQHLGWCEFLVGDLRNARVHLWDAAVRFGDADDFGGMGWCWGILGFTFLATGDLTRTREIAENLLEVSRRRGDHLSEATCMLLLASALAEAGDVHEGSELAATATRTFVEVDDVWGRTVAALIRARCARALGELDEARRLLHDALALSGATPWVGEEPRLLIELAGVESDAGCPEEAMRRARAALALVRGGMGDHDSEVRALRVLGELAWKDGDPTTAQLLLEEAVSLGGEVSVPTNAWSRAMASLAQLQASNGDLDAAAQHARLAQEHAGESIRSVVLAARAAAEVCVARGEPRAAAQLLASAVRDHGHQELVFMRTVVEDLAALR